MAKLTSLAALRASMITSLFGQRIGLDQNGLLVGIPAVRDPLEGFSSDGSTFPSTGPATLSAYGGSVLGSSVSSGSTAASPSCQQLPAPVPGVFKTIFNPSTAVITVGTTAAAAFFMGTAGSTYQYLTLAGRGANCQLYGISTSVWGVLGGNANSSYSTNVSLI